MWRWTISKRTWVIAKKQFFIFALKIFGTICVCHQRRKVSKQRWNQDEAERLRAKRLWREFDWILQLHIQKDDLFLTTLSILPTKCEFKQNKRWWRGLTAISGEILNLDVLQMQILSAMDDQRLTFPPKRGWKFKKKSKLIIIAFGCYMYEDACGLVVSQPGWGFAWS